MSSLIENLNNKNSFENRSPELVEKNDPPIIIRIKKINTRFWGTSKEKPIFEIELQIAKKSNEKLLSELNKIKKVKAKNTR
tara:strand:+ start:176 stop:418 length:243 start_codon:yes stop_codon:yes gene_type:complete